ncbi:GNAT family N-acetyltransferase [Moorena sp. SIO4A5]|uniref:GNAT family N-acetyltransferase n=1 Tax=Moorena sp. SIO4A5 TaxID=2607838 RepID=UPI0013C7CAD4|nr:GNAT family N-acetyltransferase [Moorena sp. SIO4A5]NEO24711.1 GNAT family N-acetyltransferase [Moorena sp. SIO4A5]
MTNHTTKINWRDKIKTLYQKDINPHERHDYITFIRDKFFPNHNLADNKPVIANLPTTTILQLIKACKHLKDWPLIIYCCEEYQNRLDKTMSSNNLPPHAIDNLRLLSRAYQQLGMFEAAEQTLQRAIQSGDRQPLLDEYRQQQQLANSLPKGVEALRSDQLLLTPLQTYHEEDFLWQYADPNIAELCNLPDFDDEEDWQEWLKTNQTKSTKYQFAVNHKYWGFIGSVGLEISQRIGFFFYWLGTDFQGNGYGSQAVRIMLDWASRYLGLRCCYAKAYKHNIPSKKAMEKIGFRPLPFKTTIPEREDYEEELFYWGEHQTDRLSLSEINRFFMSLGFNERVVPSQQSSNGYRRNYRPDFSPNVQKSTPNLTPQPPYPHKGRFLTKT